MRQPQPDLALEGKGIGFGFVRIWEFRVPSDKADEFRAVYGPDGEWARLFRRETAFRGTELVQSCTHPNIFLTIDRWDSLEAWAAFLRAWGDEYAALDHRSRHKLPEPARREPRGPEPWPASPLPRFPASLYHSFTPTA
jgi:heme-degrading monooxygenase HmoA